jgi:hypothetical protein
VKVQNTVSEWVPRNRWKNNDITQERDTTIWPVASITIGRTTSHLIAKRIDMMWKPDRRHQRLSPPLAMWLSCGDRLVRVPPGRVCSIGFLCWRGTSEGLGGVPWCCQTINCLAVRWRGSNVSPRTPVTNPPLVHRNVALDWSLDRSWSLSISCSQELTRVRGSPVSASVHLQELTASFCLLFKLGLYPNQSTSASVVDDTCASYIKF